MNFKHEIPHQLEVQNDKTSHLEINPNVFHPSQLAYNCEYQTYLSKFGLSQHNSKTLGRFRIGTLIHEWLEDIFSAYPNIEMEKPTELDLLDDSGIKIVGTSDCVDSQSMTIYDFKTRSGFKNYFDPPKERHLRQINLYMEMLDYPQAQIVYISKKDMSVRTYPEKGAITKNPEIVNNMITKAVEMSIVIRETGIPKSANDIPYSKCDCWICENTEENDLNFEHLQNAKL